MPAALSSRFLPLAVAGLALTWACPAGASEDDVDADTSEESSYTFLVSGSALYGSFVGGASFGTPEATEAPPSTLSGRELGETLRAGPVLGGAFVYRKEKASSIYVGGAFTFSKWTSEVGQKPAREVGVAFCLQLHADPPWMFFAGLEAGYVHDWVPRSELLELSALSTGLSAGVGIVPPWASFLIVRPQVGITALLATSASSGERAST